MELINSFVKLIYAFLDGAYKIYGTFSEMDQMFLVVLISEVLGIPQLIVKIILSVVSAVSIAIIIRKIFRKSI